MHLRDASVDLDGNIVAVGQMVYPKDDHGYFPILHIDKFCILRNRGYSLSPCSAKRDSISGFLESKTFGPQLHVPEVLKLIITHALQFGAKSRIEMSLQAQDGMIAAPGEETRRQPLSDWLLEIQEIDGSINVKLSAALRATSLIEALTKYENNYWSAEGPPCRVDVTFCVDPITRIACYGAYIKSLSNEKIPGTVRAQSVSVNSLILEQATVGTQNQFGVDSAGEWVNFYTSFRSLAITRTNSLQRSTLGFLENTHTHLWPRIWFSGIDLDVAADAMREKSTMTLTFSNGEFGSLQQGHGFDDCYRPRPSQIILEATICFEIMSSGLKLTYRALVNDLILSPMPYRQGWIDGSVTLPWEVLILRFPQFVRHRKILTVQERE